MKAENAFYRRNDLYEAESLKQSFILIYQLAPNFKKKKSYDRSSSTSDAVALRPTMEILLTNSCINQTEAVANR